jgi:hypothetical protein
MHEDHPLEAMVFRGFVWRRSLTSWTGWLEMLVTRSACRVIVIESAR